MSIVLFVSYNSTSLKPRPAFGTAWITLSVFVNIYVTDMICLRLYQQRKVFKSTLSSVHLTSYSGFTAILLESALPLAVCGVVAVVFYARTAFLPKSLWPAILVIWFTFSVSSFHFENSKRR